MSCDVIFLLVFFFNDTATTEIYTLSLHDAHPICVTMTVPRRDSAAFGCDRYRTICPRDRKSTRLNSSHANISHAVFCLKNKHAGHPVLPEPQGALEPHSTRPGPAAA